MERIQKDLLELQVSPPPLCIVEPNLSSLRKWSATIQGPPTSPYANGNFQLKIEFPKEYPQLPPNVTFITKIYHMNIAEDGFICLDILDRIKKWSSSITVRSILLGICALMANPNPSDPLNMVKANQFQNDRIKYNQIAREWTARYAT